MPLRCNMMIFAVFHLYIQANVNCRPETEKSHRVNHASRVWSLTCRLHGCKSTNRKKDAASRGSPAQPAIEACQANERAASNPMSAAYLRQRCEGYETRTAIISAVGTVQSFSSEEVKNYHYKCSILNIWNSSGNQARQNPICVNMLSHFDDPIMFFLVENRLEQEDSRTDYRETRWITIGLINNQEIVVVYTVRKETSRIISARKANRHERNDYWNR